MQEYRTIVEAVCAAPAGRPFVTLWNADETESAVSFGEFRGWAHAQGELFRRRGVKAGERVVLIMPQGVELMAAFMGAMFVGAVPAILAYPNFKVEPAKYRFGLSGVTKNLGARLVIIDEDFPRELLSGVELSGKAELVRSAGPTAGPDICGELVQVDPNNIAFLQHSAGTTGLQKGVALSHAAVLRQIRNLAEVLQLREADCIYSWLPLYHDMGLIACFVLPAVRHLRLIMQSPTDWVLQPSSMIKLMSRHRATLAWLPNFTYQFVARRTELDELGIIDLSCMRAIVNCSEPVKSESMEEFYEAFSGVGLRREALQSSYAMAENVFAVTQSNLDVGPARIRASRDLLSKEHRIRPAPDGSPSVDFLSSGRCLPGNYVKIADDQGQELPDGQVGEILIQSDSLFNGYFNRPDLTTQALRNGWYWSGDCGFVLNDEVFVTGRKSDLIIIAGKNVYPQDVEAILFAHPDIHDGRAVAFGLFNADLGTEDLIAVAEVNQEQDLVRSLAVERELRKAVTAELGVAVRAVYLKPPRWIVKSTAGKPARSATREKLLREQPELAGAGMICATSPGGIVR
jgi:fatty-acyl-CoA synthase